MARGRKSSLRIVLSRMVKKFELTFPREVTLPPSLVRWLVFRSTLTHTQRQ